MLRGDVMVELRNVFFRYASEAGEKDGAFNLRDFSLTAERGEFVLLTGPSGCGKTTVLRLLNGLIPHFYPGEIRGEVLVDGISPQDRPLYDTAENTGTVFQNPRSQFYNVDTTGELAFACENRGLPEEEIFRRIDDTVERFHIRSLMDRNIFHLSDGEKQKIACASVRVAGTELILLDEPSANLDYEGMMALRTMLQVWMEEGKTIIAAEHRIAYLWDLIHRAVILRDGSIVRQVRGREKDALTPEDLKTLGLRSIAAELPADIPLPAVTPSDRKMVLRDLHFAYPGAEQPVVDIHEMTLAEGKITAVTGTNGVGKTSFLNCLCGLEARCKGTLHFDGRDYKRKARQRLCFLVMQDSGNQLFTENVMEEVLISLPKGEEHPEERALEILRDLDLDNLQDRHPQSLSGGQKQRLAIACAIASGRKILLMDEPTSGLDWGHMMDTARLLARLCDRGVTILVVTHDSELIRACCDRKIQLIR